MCVVCSSDSQWETRFPARDIHVNVQAEKNLEEGEKNYISVYSAEERPLVAISGKSVKLTPHHYKQFKHVRRSSIFAYL